MNGLYQANPVCTVCQFLKRACSDCLRLGRTPLVPLTTPVVCVTQDLGFVPELPCTPVVPAPANPEWTGIGARVAKYLAKQKRREADPIYDAECRAQEAMFEAEKVTELSQKIHPCEVRIKFTTLLQE